MKIQLLSANYNVDNSTEEMGVAGTFTVGNEKQVLTAKVTATVKTIEPVAMPAYGTITANATLPTYQIEFSRSTTPEQADAIGVILRQTMVAIEAEAKK